MTNMTDVALEQNLIAVFEEFLAKTKNIEISLETGVDELELDSLDTLDLLMQIDKSFKINLPVEKFALCKNILDVKQLIQSSVAP